MNSRKILIIDDEEDLVFALKMQLEKEGFEVLTAYNGQDGLDTARKASPDVILLDLMLPHIDGHKVCRMLKFDGKYKNIPIVMLTAKAEKSDEKLGYEVGADAYITKPFDPQVLTSKIKELLSSK